jgi:oxygen-dependent protoporphyrinogen oxidase
MCAKKDEEKVAGFLYYPDHLVGIPKLYLKPFQDLLGTLWSLLKLVPTLTEPVFRDMIPAVVNMLAHKNNPYRMDMFKGRKDMSMGDYVAYMCGGSGFVDKVLSALVHGVSGGDVWNTSMGSGIMADLLVPLDDLPISQTRVRMADYELMTQLVGNKAVFDLASEHLDSSALWFRDGFRTLTDALAGALRANPNVTIKLDEPVTKVSYVDSLDRVSVRTHCSLLPCPQIRS